MVPFCHVTGVKPVPWCGLLPSAIVVVTPRAVPEMVARTPRVVVMVRLVVVRIATRFAINAFFDVYSRCYVLVVVVVLHYPRRFFADNFPVFKIFTLAVAWTVKVCSKGRRGEQERQSSKSNAFHGDKIPEFTRRQITR